MKVGDLVTDPINSKIGLVVDLDLCNGDAYVMWGTTENILWTEIAYLEVVQ